MINSSSSSPNNRFITKNLESKQRERQKIRGFNKELSEGNKQLKKVKDYGSRRWQYNSVVRGKLDSTADSHSDTEGRGTGQNSGKILAIVVGGATTVRFGVILFMFIRSVMKKHDALVLGKSIPPLEDRASYFIPSLEDCASYLDDKCLIGLQKEEE
ncbi:hypothetical protein GIB67_034924 [Kingdonia uniflora]|uniref:Uncharacterized protein n=1 Tax=Kingdonia uniflora TaxID=39325 RepID=A0A7J7NH31_9MAGN|nr:hypothetical protein GIB67_034924 [Kingdonia uniflora]